MYKAFKAIQRSYFRAPYKAFMVSQKQHNNVKPTGVVPDRATSMQHNIQLKSK